MDCKKIKPLLIDFADKNLNESDTAQVRDHLKKCKECRSEVEELAILMTEINKREEHQPSEQLRNNFISMLEQEKQKASITPKTVEPEVIHMVPTIKQSRILNPFYQMAAGFAILIAGVLIGLLVNKNNGVDNHQLASLQNEVSYMKQMVMLSQLEKQSPSSRIQAVSYVEEITEADPKVLKALINTMNTDNNSTVRLAATNALSKFSNNETVRTALISALATQEDPMVQIALINIMIELHEKKANNYIERLANDTEGNRTVKAIAQKGLEILI